MKTCICGHPHQSHGPRVSRGKPHREVALGCLEDGCPCEEFSEAGASNGATMDAALIARRFAEFRRAYRALEKCLRSQGIDVKSE